MSKIVSRYKRKVGRGTRVMFTGAAVAFSLILLVIVLFVAGRGVVAERSCIESGYSGYVQIEDQGYCWTVGPDSIPRLTGRVK